jgi:DNA-binding transcriptional regulator YiaG
MLNLNKLHDEILRKIEKYEDLAQKEMDLKVRYIVQQRLRLFRAKNRLTQDRLARKLGINRIQIIRWESGDFKPQKLVINLLEEYDILDKGLILEK